MKWFIVAALMGAVAIAPAQDKKPEGKKSYTFGVIAKSNSNPVFQAALKGAQARAKELSKDGLEIKIDWRTPNEEDAQKQADNIEQLVNAGVDGISISCSDASKVTNAINDAVGKGIPVMCFDSDAPKSKRFTFFGVDDIITGERVMEQLDKALGGKKGRIAILAGNQTAPNLQARVQGVMKKAKELGYEVDKGRDVFYHKETPQDAASKVEDVMKNNPDITGWAMIGGWALFTDALLKMKPGQTKIVSVDALPAELPYIESGVVQELLAQKVFDWGTQSVDLLLAKVQGKEVKERNISELVSVTNDNLKEWAQTLKSWGFEVNPKFLQ